MRVSHCLVIRSGFEPETHSLEGCCSIQLSYQTLAFGNKVAMNVARRHWATCASALNPNSRSLG